MTLRQQADARAAARRAQRARKLVEAGVHYERLPMWMDDGLCRQAAPGLFDLGERRLREARLAVALCKRCPVLGQCAEWTRLGPRPSGVVQAGKRWRL